MDTDGGPVNSSAKRAIVDSNWGSLRNRAYESASLHRAITVTSLSALFAVNHAPSQSSWPATNSRFVSSNSSARPSIDPGRTFTRVNIAYSTTAPFGDWDGSAILARVLPSLSPRSSG